MKIREIDIKGFGKFINRNFKFQPGLNLIYGENESGKSTISNYIYEVFFGGTAFGSNRAIYRKEFEKFRPWDSENFQGSIIFEYMNEEYFINRSFIKGNEKLDLINTRTGEDSKGVFKIDKSRKVEKIDESFLGINESSLRNIYCIYDDSNKGKIDLDLQTRILNQASTQSEKINLKNVFKNIDDYGDNTRIRKEIKLLNEEIKNREKEISFLKNTDPYDSYIIRLDEIKKEIEILTKNMELGISSNEDLISKRDSRIRKINQIENKEENFYEGSLKKISLSFLFILLVFLYTKKTYVLLLIIFLGVFYFISKKKYDKERLESNKNLSLLYAELDVIQDELNAVEFSNLASGNEELEKLKLERERLIERIKILDSNTEKEMCLKEEIEGLILERDRLEFKSKMAKESKRVIEELSSIDIREETINTMEIAGDYISYLTSDKYTQMYIQDNGSIRLYDKSKNRIVDLDSLSRGTIDQVYLAYRLAMIESVDVDFPIIIDDGFSFFDDRRNELALKLLVEISKKRQVLYFSSKLRDLEFFRTSGISTIELGGKNDLGYR